MSCGACRHGENYIYFMNGTAIASEGYIRAVADQHWQVAGVGDSTATARATSSGATGDRRELRLPDERHGDRRRGITCGPSLISTGRWWASTTSMATAGATSCGGIAATGENYLYPMNELAILPAEGYVRTVSNLAWKVAGTGDFTATAGPTSSGAIPPPRELPLPMNGTVILAGEVICARWPTRTGGAGDRRYDGDGKADVSGTTRGPATTCLSDGSAPRSKPAKATRARSATSAGALRCGAARAATFPGPAEANGPAFCGDNGGHEHRARYRCGGDGRHARQTAYRSPLAFSSI